MASNGQSSCFNINCFFWKVFGIWAGKKPLKYYNYYSFMYLTFTLVLYFILLTINFFFAPRKIEILIKEGIFFFTEIVVAFKVIMLLRQRNRILEVFDFLDSDRFAGKDLTAINIIDKSKSKYRVFWKVIATTSNLAFVLQCVVPLSLYLIWHENVELPVCQYYFLSEELRSDYYLVWASYQTLGIYGHMTYNINIDTFIAGMIMMTITQLRVVKHKFSTLNLDQAIISSSENISKLNEILRHYESILKYSKVVQEIISVTMFVQFCMATCIICVVALLMASSTESFIILASYLFVMVMQIFLPAYLGTQLIYESQELVYAAYNSNWIPQPERYKRSLRLFVERANTPIVLSGLKMFPLALSTFVSIIKMTYSFFTLVRKVQDREM